jgi:hypothetical protein
MVTIEVLNVRATIKQGVWTCSDPDVLRVLIGLMQLNEHQVNGGHPWPDKGIADSIVARFATSSRIVEAKRQDALHDETRLF